MGRTTLPETKRGGHCLRVIDRAGPNDLMELAFDVGPVPMQIAGVLVLEPVGSFDLRAAGELVATRLSRLPRLRQRLVRPPFGCGRSFWMDDPQFDPNRHVELTACPEPGDDDALLATALEVAVRPLPRSRPLWSVTLVSGLTGGRVAMVVVLHHVVADGLGGVALLGVLVDAVSAVDAGDRGDRAERGGLRPMPRAAPSRRELMADAWAGRIHAVARVGSLARRLRAATTELGGSRPAKAPRTSLNRPTGPRRAIGLVSVDLGAVVRAAHTEGGTVNDVVLTAVTGALGELLSRRGESVPRLVVSVPVSARATARATELGNQVGVIPMALPTGGQPTERLREVTAITRSRKTGVPAASAALLQPAFRALAALRVLGWFMDRQRLVNTFVTNVRGPAEPITFMGAEVVRVIPVSGVSGNVPVAFAVLSYAGVLTVSVLVDPDVVPDLSVLTTALDRQLQSLTTATLRR